MNLIIECKPFFFFSECMQMYVLISGGLIALILFIYFFTKITYVCIEECLFKVMVSFSYILNQKVWVMYQY